MRRLAGCALAVCVLAGFVWLAGRSLDAQLHRQEQIGAHACAQAGWLAGCPSADRQEPAFPADARAREVREIAQQIVDACERAERVGAYFRACDSIVND